MATKGQGQAGIFNRAPRRSAPRKRPALTGPQAALAALRGVAYEWDAAGDVLTWGPNASDVLGLAPSALPRTGLAFAQMVEPGGGPGRGDAMGAEGHPPSYDLRYALRFGTYRVVMVQDSGRWRTDAEGRPSHLRGLLRVDAEGSAPDLLPAAVKERSALLRRIQENMDEAVRFSHTCTLIMGVFDGGPDADAEPLSRALRPMMRRGDHMAVLGSNRFALVLACCPAKEAPAALRRARSLLETDLPDVRLGAACAPDHTFEATKLMRFAEEAVRCAADRPDRTMLHRIRHVSAAKPRGGAAADVLAALNDRRLTLACRPVVDAESRAPVRIQGSAAVLAPDGRAVALPPLVGPDPDRIGMLADARLLELAADRLFRNPEERLSLPVALATLHDPEWLSTLAAHVGARPGIASRLTVEVPEAAAADPGAAKGRLDAMKALGLAVGLGGFGTGHASLEALRLLPVDLVRIDGIFIQSLRRSTDDRLFVRTLIGMAHHLGFAVAAEWVEDASTASLLAAWGVDYMQGGLFGAAEPEAPAESALRRLMRA